MRAYKKSGGKTYWTKCSAVKQISTKPAAAAISVSGITYKSAVLSWKKVNCDGYVIMQKGKDGKYKKIKNIKGKANTSYKLTGLSANTKYTFSVKPYKSDKSGVNNYGKQSVTDFTTKKKNSWVDEMNPTDRAYYNFMRNDFSDSDWNLMVEDMTNYTKNTFEGKSLNVRFYTSGQYYFPDRYE